MPMLPLAEPAGRVVETGGSISSSPPAPGLRRLRVLLYCHDTYGLGHLSRTLAIARRLSRLDEVGAQLIVTGSPATGSFDLPPATDTVKLPALVKVGNDRYEARTLASDWPGIRAIRRELLLSAARSFRPDVVIVDHAPAGVGGEALPALQHLRRTMPGTRLVLGLRDVIDEPARVRAAWRRDGIDRLLDDLYDDILVYGRREVVDIVEAYGFSARAAARTRFVGYLGRQTTLDAASAAAKADGSRPDTPRFVIVAAGGGGDGERLLQLVIDGVRNGRSPKRTGWLLVTGPLMPRDARRRLTEAAAGIRNVRLVEFVPGLAGLMRAADGTIAMGGYNTVCEVLSAHRPAILVPRVEPRLEQWIRAARFHELGLLTALHPHELTPRRLVKRTLAAIDEPAPALPDHLLDGLDGTAEILGARTARAAARPLDAALRMAGS